MARLARGGRADIRLPRRLPVANRRHVAGVRPIADVGFLGLVAGAGPVFFVKTWTRKVRLETFNCEKLRSFRRSPRRHTAGRRVTAAASSLREQRNENEHKIQNQRQHALGRRTPRA